MFCFGLTNNFGNGFVRVITM